MLSVELPWPSRTLHPNARVHHMARARAAKKARADAGWAAKASGIRRISADALKVTATFFPPDNRRRDRDGILSACKSYFDGIADVIGVDDHRWDIAIRKGDPRPNGAVRIEIEVMR